MTGTETQERQGVRPPELDAVFDKVRPVKSVGRTAYLLFRAYKVQFPAHGNNLPDEVHERLADYAKAHGFDAEELGVAFMETLGNAASANPLIMALDALHADPWRVPVPGIPYKSAIDVATLYHHAQRTAKGEPVWFAPRYLAQLLGISRMHLWRIHRLLCQRGVLTLTAAGVKRQKAAEYAYTGPAQDGVKVSHVTQSQGPCLNTTTIPRPAPEPDEPVEPDELVEPTLEPDPLTLGGGGDNPPREEENTEALDGKSEPPQVDAANVDRRPTAADKPNHRDALAILGATLDDAADDPKWQARMADSEQRRQEAAEREREEQKRQDREKHPDKHLRLTVNQTEPDHVPGVIADFLKATNRDRALKRVSSVIGQCGQRATVAGACELLAEGVTGDAAMRYLEYRAKNQSERDADREHVPTNAEARRVVAMAGCN